MLVCRDVDYYANECKSKQNNKLIETLGSLDYFEFSKKEALDLALKNKSIIKMVLEDEYEESDQEETSHIMESSSISLGDLLGEEFILNNENEAIKGD